MEVFPNELAQRHTSYSIVSNAGNILFRDDGADTGAPLHLYCVDLRGRSTWTFAGEEGVPLSAWPLTWSGPTLRDDGVILFPTSYGKLYAVGPDGNKRWEFDIGQENSAGFVQSIRWPG